MSNNQPSSSSVFPGPPSSSSEQAGSSQFKSQSTGNPQNYSYYGNIPAWAPATGSYPYINASQSYYHSGYNTTQISPQSQPKHKPTPSPSPSPSPPPPESYHDWDKAIHSFLVRLGLTQAASGFESDMLIMNATWEQKNVPGALIELSKRISSLVGTEPTDVNVPGPKNENTTGAKPLEERRLDYVHLAKDFTPQSQSKINKQISLFLARNRARNDASNRTEFLNSPAGSHQQGTEMAVDGDANPTTSVSASCARVDAKMLNRDVQMKYDIARNEDGPLSRTVFGGGSNVKVQNRGGDDNSEEHQQGDSKTSTTNVPVQSTSTELNWTAKRHPGLDERLHNIEDHLAVRYVPSSPRTLLARLEYLEKHIIRLEKDYPPWAALHFNQPNRGWPPPPRQTPIIVPPHLRDIQDKGVTVASDEKRGSAAEGKSRKTNSSLQRAVLERLEVKQAMSDLEGKG